MPAYLIAEIEVTDPVGYDEYKKRVPAVIAAYGGRYLARGGAIEVLEGRWQPKRIAIIEFPNLASIKAFWESPEYQPLRKIRERCAKSNLVVSEGL